MERPAHDLDLTDEELEKLYTRLLHKAIINEGSDCWNYDGYLLPIGYARISIGRGKMGYAHRIAYIATKGKIPHGQIIRHSCHNRACFNPDHLDVGTHQDNWDDKFKANRFGAAAKVSAEEVSEMRQLYAQGYSTREIANEFGLARNTVWQIVTKRSWKKVEA